MASWERNDSAPAKKLRCPTCPGLPWIQAVFWLEWDNRSKPIALAVSSRLPRRAVGAKPTCPGLPWRDLLCAYIPDTGPTSEPANQQRWRFQCVPAPPGFFRSL